MNKKFIIFIFIISILICLPIWSNEYFLTQDGSAHIYSSYVISELLKGNELFYKFFSFNSFATPNALGHYLIYLLLFIFSPFLVSKIISTITLLGLPFSMIWFRFVTKAENDLFLTFLLGAAISFNWFWLAGFYNFLIGSILLVFTFGLFHIWKDTLNVTKAFIFSTLFFLVYLSHLICFLVLAGSVFVMLISLYRKNLKRAATYVFIAILPSIICFVIYKLNTQNESVPFQPVWRHLENPASIFNWLKQISTVDSFFIISRKTLPFIDNFSSFYYFFTPLMWLLIVVFILLVATFNIEGIKNFFSLEKFPYIFLFLFSVVFSVIAPDDFGTSNGTVLRERIFFFSFVFLIPLFEIENKGIYKKIIIGILSFIISFQILATFEYVHKYNRTVSEFSQISKHLNSEETYVTISILDKTDEKFAAKPIPQMNNLFAINENIIIWDNYELGHYLFPIVSVTSKQRENILNFTRNNVISKNSNKTLIKIKISVLNSILDNDSNRIDNIIIYGYDEEIEKRLNFISVAKQIYADENIRLFRLKK